jgi:hypothetical protein
VATGGAVAEQQPASTAARRGILVADGAADAPGGPAMIATLPGAADALVRYAFGYPGT